jgi:hypothetical protein
MLSAAFLILRLMTASVSQDAEQGREASTRAAIDDIAKSGRCLAVTESPDDRVAPPRMIPPGKPPLLSFRYYEAKERYGTGNTGLMLDDAGH